MTTAVQLVENYLRLNGYFTVTEFQVQSPMAGGPEQFETATDIDILALRLPWAARTVLRQGEGEDRGELLLEEDPALAMARDVPDVLIGEVKEGAARLNRRLTTVEVLHPVLHRIGCVPEEHIAGIAEKLRRRGELRIDPPGLACRVRLASFCGYVEEPPEPVALVITLGHILRFIQERLERYEAVLHSAQFLDATLGLLKLMRKLDLRLAFPEERQE